MNSAESIMNALEVMATRKDVLDWHVLMDGAMKLCALLQNEENELAEMEYILIRMKAAYVSDGKPANQAKLLVEADPLYLDLMKKRAFIKRCDETIRLAKKHASLSSEMNRY